MIPWFDLPVLPLGPLDLDLASLLAIAGILVAMALVRRRARRAGLSSRRAVDGLFLMVVCGLFFGHTVDVLLYHWDDLQSSWSLILPWNGGTCSLWAGLVVAVLAFFRQPGAGLRWDYLDHTMPCCWGWASCAQAVFWATITPAASLGSSWQWRTQGAAVTTSASMRLCWSSRSMGCCFPSNGACHDCAPACLVESPYSDTLPAALCLNSCVGATSSSLAVTRTRNTQDLPSSNTAQPFWPSPASPSYGCVA
jgi:hypothetical protein